MKQFPVCLFQTHNAKDNLNSISNKCRAYYPSFPVWKLKLKITSLTLACQWTPSWNWDWNFAFISLLLKGDRDLPAAAIGIIYLINLDNDAPKDLINSEIVFYVFYSKNVFYFILCIYFILICFIINHVCWM